MEDNFYQVSTERLIAPPKEQQKKLRQDKNSFIKERPLITAEIESLKAEIAFREKVDSITETKDPEVFMREVEVNKQVCTILRKYLENLETKVRMFDDNKPLK